MSYNYIKEFDKWNKIKKVLDIKDFEPDFFFLEREVWWTSIGINVSSEIDGKDDKFIRPSLIIKKLSENMLIVLPITSKIRNDIYSYTISHHKVSGTILLSQIRMISAHRLIKLICRMNETAFEAVIDQLVTLLSNKTPPAPGVSFATVTEL